MRFLSQRGYRWSTIGEDVDGRENNENIPLSTYRVTSAKGRRTTPTTYHNGHEPPKDYDWRSYRMSMWNPLWLRSVPLLAISAGFACLAAVSIILWHYSTVHNGFTLISTNHYSWTYGPTAVLVLVVAVWRQVDYHCKALAPWRALQQGGARAADSLLLDYVSPFLPIALYRALSKRHWTISATISGFILLKLITIASTGLLSLAPTKITLPKSGLVGVSQLDGLLVNTSTFAPSPTLFDPSIVYNAFGVMAKGLPYAEGTKPNLVYESFASPQTGAHRNATISAVVNAFIPRLTCEEVNVFINLEPKNSTDTYPQDKVNITSSSCVLADPYWRPTIHVLNPLEDLVPPRQLSGVMATVDCTNTPPGGEQLLVLADIRYNQTLADPSVTYAMDAIVNATNGTTEVKQVTAILCWPSYSVEEVTVTYDMAQNPPNITVSESNPRTNRTFPNISYLNLSNLFTDSLSPVQTTFGDDTSGAVSLEYPDPMFKMMGQVNGGGYQALLNATAMSEAAQIVFKNTVVQIVHKNLLRRHAYPLTGTTSYSEQRLEIRTVSFTLMLCGFAAMIGLSTFVFFTRPMNTVPRDPEPIATTALVLTQSREVQDLLASSQVAGQTLRQKLSRHRFSTNLSNGVEGRHTFQIWATESSVLHDAPLAATNPSVFHWWKPLWTRLPILISISFIVLALVVVLEVLQRVSDRENGITSMPDTSGFIITVTTRWIPAVVVVLVATSFNAYDFTTSTFAPYHTLKRSSAPASRSLMSCLIGKLPPHALSTSLRHHHWSALFSSIAALVGSLLTIIVSGLYTSNDVNTPVPFHLQSTDSFNPAWPNSVINDGGAAVVASLTENLNLSYPPFTYGELAFPTLQPLTSASVYGGSNSETTMTVTIPALRASLDCEYLSPVQFNITTSYIPENSGVALGVQGTIPLPESCPFGGIGGNLSYMDLPLGSQPGTNSSYFGLMTDLHVGPWPADYFTSGGELEIGAQKDNPPGCPSLAFTFGYYDITDSFNAAQPKATAMFCYQRMQQVLTNVTLTLPGLSIAPDHPPIPDESTVKLLSSGPNGETAFEYRIQLHMDKQFSLFTQSQYSTGESGLTAMDNFFLGVLFGKQPIPQTALEGAANRETVMKGIQGFYRRYMAQAISENMRVKYADGSQAQNFTGIAINHNNPRLFQNNASKLTLQIMLVFMLTCSLLAFFLTGTRHILPHNPWTIAGKASLLAGSELCGESLRELIPPGALWMSDRELEENGVWQGWLFSLGWWDWKWGEKRRWGIDVGQAESEG